MQGFSFFYIFAMLQMGLFSIIKLLHCHLIIQRGAVQYLCRKGRATLAYSVDPISNPFNGGISSPFIRSKVKLPTWPRLKLPQQLFEPSSSIIFKSRQTLEKVSCEVTLIRCREPYFIIVRTQTSQLALIISIKLVSRPWLMDSVKSSKQRYYFEWERRNRRE